MKVSDVLDIVIGVAALGFILYRQFQRRPIRSGANTRMAAGKLADGRAVGGFVRRAPRL